VGNVGNSGIFRVRSNLGVDWSLGAFAVNWTARYYSGMKESCVPNRPCTEPDHIANGEEDAIRRVGSNTFHDLQVSYKAPWDATIAIGANNVFDHKGPLMFSNSEYRHSDFAYYGGFDFDRYLYVKYTQRF
jgi:iron complex outermembrane receptor protein